MTTMERVKFYMAGGMGGLTIEQQMEWRNNIEDRINQAAPHSPTYFFQPPYYYQPDGDYHRSELEAMRFDLDRLRHSDIMIVNFNVPSSLGTMYEIAVAHENRIPIIGLNENSAKIHPWALVSCTRICESREELVNHIVNFYLT